MSWSVLLTESDKQRKNEQGNYKWKKSMGNHTNNEEIKWKTKQTILKTQS